VEGPLTATRSPQGRPAIFEAGESGAGVELAAKLADAVYTVPPEKSASIQRRQLIRQTAAKHGRSEDTVKVIPGIQPIVAATTNKVEEKLELPRSIADPVKEMGRLIIQVDISKYDLTRSFHHLSLNRVSQVQQNPLPRRWSRRSGA